MPEFSDLTRQECTDLLAGHHFGRIAVHDGTGLAIFPVNYTWSDGHVAIRTGPDRKINLVAQSQVAFEIDEVDETTRTGWSVLVTGVGYEVTDSIDDASQVMRSVPVDTWAPGGNERWLRVEPRSITGRRIQPDHS